MKKHNPFPGQVTRQAPLDGSYDDQDNEELREVAAISEAGVVTSEVLDTGGNLVKGVHRPVLDIDMPVRLVPSSTEGHFHLHIDKPMMWDTYVDLLEALEEAGIVEKGYVTVSKRRGYTAVRLQGVTK